jgi:hypothetical protein
VSVQLTWNTPFTLLAPRSQVQVLRKPTAHMPMNDHHLPSPDPAGTFATIRSEFERTTASIAPFDDARPSTPAAYNAIGKMIMQSYLDAVEEIDGLGLPYHHNLGVAFFCELHTRACDHYYREYDRIHGLTDTAEAHEIRRSKRTLVDLITAVGRRLPSLNLSIQNREWDVAFAGTTTFPWQSLRGNLAQDGISLRKGSTGKAGTFPRTGVQAAMLRAWVHTIHVEIASMLGVASSSIKSYGPDPVSPLLARMSSTPTLSDAAPDLLITGTLGAFGARMTALSAMARRIPVLTFHHGAQYLIFDEPYYDLYEGALPDFKVVYGNPGGPSSGDLATTKINIRGSAIRLFPRTDHTISQLRTAGDVDRLVSLKGKSVLYFATEVESVRYGPFRDVHASTYLSWQRKLLAWLQSQTGIPPTIRLHPKRPSTHFDPKGYPLGSADLAEEIQRADVLVIDYPTTSLPIALATTKPVLYFDLGLRQLFPAATQAIQDRCIAATTDLFEPSEGLAIMERNLGKSCRDTFTNAFSVAPNSSDELSDSANAIAQALAIR